jgi:hypothetical protein
MLQLARYCSIAMLMFSTASFAPRATSPQYPGGVAGGTQSACLSDAGCQVSGKDRE